MTPRRAIVGTLCVVLSLSLSVLAAFASPLAAIALLLLAALAPLLWVIAPTAISTVVRQPRAASVARTKPRLGVARDPAPTEDHAIIELVLASTPRSLRSAEHIAS